jgi:hypothetical protein
MLFISEWQAVSPEEITLRYLMGQAFSVGRRVLRLRSGQVLMID